MQDNKFELFFKKYSGGITSILEKIELKSVVELLQTLMNARANKQRIFFIGNGGSASISSHAATDFAKDRFSEERYVFKVLSLTDNTSFITATANDFGYENIFVKQMKCLLSKGDVVIAISSSGNSLNVINAVEFATQQGAQTISIVGFDGGRLSKISQQTIHIPTKCGQYGFAEDITMILLHMLSIYIYENDHSELHTK